jgi:N-acetylmuramoyl-L-alanine amidase
MRPMRNCLVLLMFVLGGCAPFAKRSSIEAQWEPSPNFDERRPNFVIIHHTGGNTTAEALHTLTDRIREVSAHYLIGRDGVVYQLVDERARAWHAGDSRWGSTVDLNSSSLGIELDNNGEEPFPEEQISALLGLLDAMQRRYHIPAANFLGHADIAPRRKADPSRYFPWEMLAHRGFGIWCDSPLEEAPSSFDSTLALRALGYDVADVDAAIRAFTLHFVPDDSAPILTDRARSVLWCLLTTRIGAEARSVY